LNSAKRFVYGVPAMAEENGKAKKDVEGDAESSGPEFVPTMELLRRDAAKRGPWTDEDERFFQLMVKEFGGDGADLDD
jgi:hypothetical protein